MKIIPLSEGTFTVDSSKQFIPFNKEKHILSQRTSGSLLVEIQPFVIITSKDIILLDTGLGFEINGQMQIYKNLELAGISANDISKVFLSHLHKDHSGGIQLKPDNQALSFPNAVYYVNENELKFALEKGSSSYISNDFSLLENSSRVVRLTDESGIIDNYITYQVTGAHSAYHQVFWIEEDGQKVFFGGDDAPQHQQMKHRFIAKYDYNGKKATELRKEWWEKGNEERWTFLFYHDIKSPTYKNT